MNYYDSEIVEGVLYMPDDPDYLGLPHQLALMAKEAHSQLEEALGIIKDMEHIRDWKDWKPIRERIDVLRLKQ